MIIWTGYDTTNIGYDYFELVMTPLILVMIIWTGYDTTNIGYDYLNWLWHH